MADHRIFPHGAPEQLTDGVWLVTGELAFPLRRNMTILRLPTGELLLFSAIALDAGGLRQLEALGQPAYAVVPSTAHSMDIAFFKARYPDLKVLMPAVHRAAVEAKVAVAGTVEDVLPQFGFRLHAVPGTREAEYVYEWPLRSGGRMLMTCDALGSANIEAKGKGFGSALVRLLGVPGNRLGFTRIYRWRIITDLAAMKRFVGGLADIPDLRLITVAHGDPVSHDVAGALRAAAD